MKTYQGQRLFRVGKIVNTQGLRGELRIIPVTDFPDRFQPECEFVIVGNTGQQELVVVEQARNHKNFILLKFKGYESINDVEKWKGSELYVTEANLAELDEEEYYFHDLLGLSVQTEAGEPVGTLVDILQTGANDVYVVKRDGQKDLLLPVIDECVLDIDIPGEKIVVHILPGLE